MSERLTIAHWSEDDQPREKLRDNGAQALSDAELLAILVGSGSSQRRQMEKPEERPDLGTATKIYNHMHPLLQDSDVEEFWLLLMNQNFRLIKQVRISHGGITETAVDIRIIMREAVLANATIIAVCHNHPSGNLRPSQHDNDLTVQLQQASKLMRIHFMDHVILTDGNYFSYHETGRL